MSHSFRVAPVRFSRMIRLALCWALIPAGATSTFFGISAAANRKLAAHSSDAAEKIYSSAENSDTFNKTSTTSRRQSFGLGIAPYNDLWTLGILPSLIAPIGSNFSLSLNGAGAYVNVPNSTSLNITGAITVEAWVKTNSATAQQGIIERYNTFGFGTFDGGYALRLAGGKLQFYTLKNGNEFDVIESVSLLSTGVWHHVAGVYDGSFLKVYIDGKLNASKPSTFSPVSGTASVKIGARGDDAATPFIGLVDEARITAAAVYSTDFTPQPSLTAVLGTRGLWKFDDQTANDFSGNLNHGSLIGGATFSPDVPVNAVGQLVVGNFGFETPVIGVGNFQYNPVGGSWTFAGSTGVSGNGSGFTSGNPAAPEGAQVGILQGGNLSVISQSISGFQSGTSYTIVFAAAQRGNCCNAGGQDFQVYLDNTLLGTFHPTDTTYVDYSTPLFMTAVGAHTLKFVGLNSLGGDHSAFIDNVRINVVGNNFGFEAPAIGVGNFQYNPAGGSWTFAGNSGVSANGSGFTAGNPPAPEGSQVAFLQGGSTSVISQSISGFQSGAYTVTFAAAQRGNWNQGGQDFQVFLDTISLGTFRPGSTSYADMTTSPFTIAGGTSHTLKFVGLDSSGGDNTAFIDNVRISAAVGPVGYWKFDEGSGLTAADSSGNGNNGTLQNGTTWTSGRVNGALSFNGAGSYVQVGAQPSLAMSTAMTISAWINPTGDGIIVNKEGEYEVALLGGHLQWAIANSNPGWAWIDTGYIPPLNQWAHIAVTYDSGTVKTYANGVLAHTYLGAGTIGDVDVGENDFRIGGRQCCVQYFGGSIDEVYVYNRVLSATEIQGFVNIPPTRTGSITASPNPIQVCDGSGLGITTLSWSSSGTSVVEVHVGSPTGALFAQTGASGTSTTGKWVSNGTVFYLQDVSGGLPLTAANTLATVNVGVTTAGCPQNAATFISQSVPTSMVAGQSYNVSVTMKNAGTNTWTSATSYGLGSQNPQDNGIWGFARVALPASVTPGTQTSFNFTVTAPATAGTYNFQWRMVQDGVMWFGDYSPNVAVSVAPACTVPIAAQPSSVPPDLVWVEDQAPTGAVLAGNWVWDTNQKASGLQSNTEPAAAGAHQHYFYGASQPLAINAGDKLVSYVLLNPCNPPQEIMLQWNDSASWEHRAIWGADLIPWGAPGTASRLSMGALPQTGAWVRLEVPASTVGLEGKTISGMAFTLYDGQAWFDRAGKLSRLKPISATASNSYPGAPPSQAVDGNLGTMWNSGGFAPQWIQLDLGEPSTVSQIRLNVAQLPDGQTTHEIYGGTDPQALTLIRTVSGFTQSGQWLEPTFSPAINNIRYLKIQTTVSPSWVAWNEIEVYGATALVGYWKFDEGSGLTAADSSGSGNNGTLQNGVTWTTGAAGNALSFNGIDGYVQVGPAVNLTMTNTMTLAAWIYPTGTGIIVNKEGEYEIARFPDGTIQWAIANTNPGWAWISTGFVAALNQWTHIAIVYDNGTVRSYANGALVHTFAGAGSIGDVVPTQNDFRIGGRQCCVQFFQGKLDEVRAYNRVLSAAEIQNLVNPTGSRSPHNATQTPWPVPSNSNIEVEDFDDWNPPKGEGHTYHDDDAGNGWGLYRPGEDVDIANSSDLGGGYVVGNAHGREWLEYTVNVTSSPCDIQVRVASGGPGGTFHVEFDGINKTGPIQVPNTGAWSNWVTLTMPNVSLPLGQHIMRLALDTNGTQPYPAVADFNYIRIVASGSPNQPPAVSITSPASGAGFTAPATISISAAASDPDGSVSKVEFFGDGALIGTVTAAPYNVTWSNVAAGTHSITAKATDNLGVTTTSAAVSITVNPPANQPPAVSITSPASGASFTAPATISISAAASDPDGSVSKVEFFGDGTLIGTATVAPYSSTWSNVAAGTHSITAKATDNLGATTTSAAVSITVNSLSPPSLQAPTDSLTANQIGRLTSVGNGSMRIFNSYDALGRTTQTIHKLDGTSYVTLTRYGYPLNPNTPGLGTAISFQSLPDFERLDYTYDASGAQQSIMSTPSGRAQQTIVSGVLRNARGQTTQVVYGNGAVTTHSYNDATNLRLSEIKTVVGTTTLQDYSYSFDNNGNVISVTDNFNQSFNATYAYDSLDQLKSMTPAGQLALLYQYDNLGNLTNKENVTQTYGGVGRGPHALATAQGLIYNYDANGNLIETRDSSTNLKTAITWNAENMPIQVVQSGISIYQKFFLGETLWKKVEPNVTTYYLPSMRVENGLFRKFFGGFAERSPDGTLKFYHDDHLGSASVVTDSVGNVIDRQAYMPYGEDRPNSVSGTFAPKYQFNFKERESTGFYDYGARLYNPSTGRWLSVDTNATDGLNRYAYVRNNPLAYVDPTGHMSYFPLVFSFAGQDKEQSTNKRTYSPEEVIGMLSTKPQPALKWVDRNIAFLTTPLGKNLGIKGWTETKLRASGIGIPVRRPQKSNDNFTNGFWTVDVALVSLSINGEHVEKVSADPEGYYIRLEIRPGTEAHKLLEKNEFNFRETIGFEGAIKIDHGFLEVHPNTAEKNPNPKFY